MKAKILIVDDEPNSALAQDLEQEGYEVAIAEDEPEALYLLDESQPDLIILDIGFGYDKSKGFDIHDEIREKDRTTPIIMLTGLNGDDFEVRSLEHKATDFVRKSVSTRVLLARVRRRLPRALRELIVIDDYIKIDASNSSVQVKRNGEWEKVHLEPKEEALLMKLLNNRGRVIVRESLENFFPDAKNPAATVRSYISVLRKQLEPDPLNPQYILTKRGVGYAFKDYR